MSLSWGAADPVRYLFGCDVCGREVVHEIETITVADRPRPGTCPDCGAPQSWGVQLRKDYPQDKARADHQRIRRALGFYGGPEEVR